MTRSFEINADVVDRHRSVLHLRVCARVEGAYFLGPLVKRNMTRYRDLRLRVEAVFGGRDEATYFRVVVGRHRYESVAVVSSNLLVRVPDVRYVGRAHEIVTHPTLRGVHVRL